jgi:hypothetical protein
VIKRRVFSFHQCPVKIHGVDGEGNEFVDSVNGATFGWDGEKAHLASRIKIHRDGEATYVGAYVFAHELWINDTNKKHHYYSVAPLVMCLFDDDYLAIDGIFEMVPDAAILTEINAQRHEAGIGVFKPKLFEIDHRSKAEKKLIEIYSWFCKRW